MRKQWLVAALLGGFSVMSMAANEVDLQHFNKLLPNASVNMVAPSAIDGLYEVVINESPYPIYISKDGKYIVEGQMVDLIRGVNLTEERSNTANKKLIDEVNIDEMISYKSPKEKHIITVFTDTDCPYCQVLHKELDQYLEAGITVRYLAFPRMGLNSKGYNEMVSVWCAEDPMLAMSEVKLKKKIKPNKCDTHPIDKQYELGKKIGITGTPAIILEDGSVISGYAPAKELLKIIEMRKAK